MEAKITHYPIQRRNCLRLYQLIEDSTVALVVIIAYTSFYGKKIIVIKLSSKLSLQISDHLSFILFKGSIKACLPGLIDWKYLQSICVQLAILLKY